MSGPFGWPSSVLEKDDALTSMCGGEYVRQMAHEHVAEETTMVTMVWST